METFCRGLPATETSTFGVGVFFAGFFLSSSFFFSLAAVSESGSVTLGSASSDLESSWSV